MIEVKSLEQYSSLIDGLKTRTSRKVLKTNCFLTPAEIRAYIDGHSWSYIEGPEELYFFHEDETAVHLYYYAAKELKPELEDEFALPLMADFVLRERELAAFEQNTLPVWEQKGFLRYKNYQRMRRMLPAEESRGEEPAKESSVSGRLEGESLQITAAKVEQAEEIRLLWERFLDKYDIVLPSLEETREQIQKGNVVCCMEQGKVCGAILVEVNGRSGLIQHVVVHESWRRRSIGERMIQYIYGFMPQRGVTDFKLWVDVKNVAAIKLYMKCGLSKDGVFSAKLMKG